MQASLGTGVPLCDLQVQQTSIQQDIERAAGRVLASGQFILGPEVKSFEQEVANYCGTGFGVGCASGTDALLLALHALDVGPGDEVIMPPFTFFASAGSVARTGTHGRNPDRPADQAAHAAGAHRRGSVRWAHRWLRGDVR